MGKLEVRVEGGMVRWTYGSLIGWAMGHYRYGSLNVFYHFVSTAIGFGHWRGFVFSLGT
jgi:hypothetical protein